MCYRTHATTTATATSKFVLKVISLERVAFHFTFRFGGRAGVLALLA